MVCPGHCVEFDCWDQLVVSICVVDEFGWDSEKKVLLACLLPFINFVSVSIHFIHPSSISFTSFYLFAFLPFVLGLLLGLLARGRPLSRQSL
jgi:hypothetical protein